MEIKEIHLENNENNENLKIPQKNHMRILEFKARIMKIMKIFQLHANYIKI